MYKHRTFILWEKTSVIFILTDPINNQKKSNEFHGIFIVILFQKQNAIEKLKIKLTCVFLSWIMYKIT